MKEYKSETKSITEDYEVDLEDESNFDKCGQFISVTNVGENSVGLLISTTGSSYGDEIPIPPSSNFTRSFSVAKFKLIHSSNTTVNYYTDTSKSN